MPVSATLIYLREKEQFESYTMGCLWALATEQRFLDDQKKPTLQRWHEINNPQKRYAVKKTTGDLIMRELLGAW